MTNKAPKESIRRPQLDFLGEWVELQRKIGEDAQRVLDNHGDKVAIEMARGKGYAIKLFSDQDSLQSQDTTLGILLNYPEYSFGLLACLNGDSFLQRMTEKGGIQKLYEMNPEGKNRITLSMEEKFPLMDLTIREKVVNGEYGSLGILYPSQEVLRFYEKCIYTLMRTTIFNLPD